MNGLGLATFPAANLELITLDLHKSLKYCDDIKFRKEINSANKKLLLNLSGTFRDIVDLTILDFVHELYLNSCHNVTTTHHLAKIHTLLLISCQNVNDVSIPRIDYFF